MEREGGIMKGEREKWRKRRENKREREREARNVEERRRIESERYMASFPLIQDFTFLDTLSHFDRERIPERVVHAKGAGAYPSNTHVYMHHVTE